MHRHQYNTIEEEYKEVNFHALPNSIDISEKMATVTLLPVLLLYQLLLSSLEYDTGVCCGHILILQEPDGVDDIACHLC